MRVNQIFATELSKLLHPDDVAWVHDYHLFPLAKAVRDLGHRDKIGFSRHIPFPPPEILTALPNHDQLIPAMCRYDLVGFQTEIEAENFALYLRPPDQELGETLAPLQRIDTIVVCAENMALAVSMP